MKKLMILSVTALGLMAASCAKSRTCTCTTNVTDVTFTDYAVNNQFQTDDTQTDTYTTATTVTMDELKKKDAARKVGCYSGTSEEKEIRTGGSGQTAYVETETTTRTSDCEVK
jgi:hypothetical protein